MLLQNIQHPSYDLQITLAQILDINKDIIQVKNDKNVKIFGQDLIDITLKAHRYIE